MQANELNLVYSSNKSTFCVHGFTKLCVAMVLPERSHVCEGWAELPDILQPVRNPSLLLR